MALARSGGFLLGLRRQGGLRCRLLKDRVGGQDSRQFQAVAGGADRLRGGGVLPAVGLEQFERDLKSEEIKATLVESHRLADALGINGTPSYIIGGDVVPGAVGADKLRSHIASVRKCGQAVC